MYKTLVAYDRTLTVFLHDLIPHNSFFNDVFSFFSIYGFSIAVWLLLLLVVVILEERKNKKFIWYLLSSIGSTFFFVEFVLKPFFARTRPVFLFKTFLTACPTGFSFPSGHAAVAFAAATIFAFFDKKRFWLYYILSFLIAFSRIYLGCHYLVDTLAGAIVGIFVAKTLLKLFKKK